MIVNFRHKGLRKLYEKGETKGIEHIYVNKLRRILARLSVSTRPEDMDLPGYALHPLKGDLKGYWSVTVGANWRVIFQFDGVDIRDVDLIDYH